MTQQQAILNAPKQEADYINFHDFLKLYEGQRAEWLMGRVEVHVTNNVKHQELLGFLHSLLSLYLGFKDLGKVFLAGIVMYVGDDKPAREPDLLVVLNEHLDRIKPTYLDGAGDVVFEIVSLETTARDYGHKFIEYEAAGVREYWRIDPVRHQAYLYILNDNRLFHSVEPDQTGRLPSSVMPGFAIKPEVLWQDSLPNGVEIVEMAQAMVRS